MKKQSILTGWADAVSGYVAKHSAQSFMAKPQLAMAGASCGASCGAADPDPKQPEEKPSACGSACGVADPDPKQSEEKPSACDSACGAGDK